MPKSDLNKLFRKALKASATNPRRGPRRINWEKSDTMGSLAGNPNAYTAYQRGYGSQSIKVPRQKLFRRKAHKLKALGKEKLKEKFNVNELAEFFDIPTWEDIDENFSDYSADNDIWGYAHREALEEGKSEEEAEEIALQAESDARDEYYTKWHDAMISAVEKTMAHIHMDLTPVKPKDSKPGLRPYEYKVSPTKDWKDSADQIRDIINGVGMFGFDTLKEFLDSGPYTAREAVLSHLHYANSYADVYGDRSAKDIYHREMR